VLILQVQQGEGEMSLLLEEMFRLLPEEMFQLVPGKILRRGKISRAEEMFQLPPGELATFLA
jgi:hypothetical protein